MDTVKQLYVINKIKTTLIHDEIKNISDGMKNYQR